MNKQPGDIDLPVPAEHAAEFNRLVMRFAELMPRMAVTFAAASAAGDVATKRSAAATFANDTAQLRLALVGLRAIMTSIAQNHPELADTIAKAMAANEAMMEGHERNMRELESALDGLSGPVGSA